MGILFGNLENNREVTFINISNAYKDIFSDDINVSGFIYDLGFMYEFQFGKDPNDPKSLPKQSLTVGLYGHGNTSFTTKTTSVRTRFNINYTQDTISNNTNVKDSGKLPGQITLGLVYRSKSKWLIGLDYTYSDWGKFENPAADFDGQSNALFKSSRITGGLQFTPDATSYNRYLKRVGYRIGGYYFNDPRLEDLKTYAITFGAGFPIVLSRNRTSFLNLAVELGSNVSDTIDENFWKISLGFTLNDNSWFFKRKFN